MESEIKELYGKLIAAYTENKLKQLSTQIIGAYKNGNRGILDKFANRIMINPMDYKNKINRLFMKIIVFYHPDKYNSIINTLTKYYQENNHDELLKYARYLALPGYYSDQEVSDRYAFDFKEEYFYDQDDFGYTEHEASWGDSYNFEDEYSDERSSDDEPMEYGFIEAVKYLMYGNKDIHILAKDLYYLEGELNLAFRDIEDLEGAEYCVNVVSMDLSNNSISNIFPLKSLPYLVALDLSHNQIYDITDLEEITPLKVLDLSYNEIEDIDPLLKLHHLEYVNLISNNFSSKSTLETLKSRGVIVVY